MLNQSLTRRSLLQGLLASAACTLPLADSMAVAQPQYGGSNGQQRGEMGRMAGAFRRQFSVPASSIAISHNGQFAFDEAVGMGDRQHLTPVRQSSLFRIASVTMPITSVTVFSLIEQGKLNLTDKVFGPSSILGTKYGNPPYKQYVTDITVDHLLTHTAGGWPSGPTDPMMRNTSWDQTKLITETIASVPLANPPGTNWAFSNFDYCVLGRVIEAVTGQPYASYVQANILAPCGISTMQIAANKESHKAANEVVYYGQFSEDPYKINITRMDSDAGWIASSTELVQFLNHVAGAPGIPALLKPATIQAMTTPAPAYPQGQARYARGWMVGGNGGGDWWHNGSLPGSTTMMSRTASGICWAALTNTRTQPSNEIDTALAQLMADMLRVVPAWNS
jgi:CubicO group peptidase (beta-lactamase class C family)